MKKISRLTLEEIRRSNGKATAGIMDIQGRDLYVETYGNIEKPAIAFLHGGPATSCVEQREMSELLARKYFVVSFDQYGSMSATLEDASDFRSGTARCSVRVFERYSYAGGNRVSLNITLFQNDKDPVQLSAITAGGSQAVFFKINTWGEETFLDKLIELLDFAN